MPILGARNMSKFLFSRGLQILINICKRHVNYLISNLLSLNLPEALLDKDIIPLLINCKLCSFFIATRMHVLID